MKVSDILELEDGFNVPSVEKCIISKIGNIQSGPNGKYQFLTIIGSEADRLRVKIKTEDLFIDDSGLGEDDVAYISFKAGPPTVKGSKNPTGLTFSGGDKPMLVVTAGAVGMFTIKGIEEDAPEDGKVTEDDRALLAELFEDTLPEQSITLPETEPSILDYDFEGPSDNTIIECFYERLHMLRVLQRENVRNGSPFSEESLFPMVTSIYIDANRAGNKILPQKKTKSRYDPYEKQYNPKPKVEEGAAEKKPAAPVEEPKEKEAAIDSKGTLTFSEVITSAIEAQKDLWPYRTPNQSGKGTVGEVLLDDERRPKAVAWMFSKDASELTEKAKKAHESIEIIVKALPCKTTICSEAMMTDYVKVNLLRGINIDDPEHCDRVMEMISQVLNEAGITGKYTDSFQIAKAYFSLPEEQRANDIPF